jgi:hypothetical protein
MKLQKQRVAIAGAAFVHASGIFDKPERETRWISGGLRTE